MPDNSRINIETLCQCIDTEVKDMRLKELSEDDRMRFPLENEDGRIVRLDLEKDS